MQVFPWSEGALYQVYAAPGQITNIALEPGERLTGPGPIAAGDTARWIIGDTTSGAGSTARVHILVKPTRPDITSNLVVNTDRRTYHIELRANEEAWTSCSDGATAASFSRCLTTLAETKKAAAISSSLRPLSRIAWKAWNWSSG